MGLPQDLKSDFVSALFRNEALQQVPTGCSPGGPILSNTVCISDPLGQWPSVQKEVLKFAEYGEIARVDTSLALVLKRILVTFFDVRCAQRVLLQLGAGVAEPFPAAVHDCRTVRVEIAAFSQKAGTMGGFQRFGEVMNLTMLRDDAIVEFYDMRAAHALLVAAGGTASPWSAEQAQKATVVSPAPSLRSGSSTPPAVHSTAAPSPPSGRFVLEELAQICSAASVATSVSAPGLTLMDAGGDPSSSGTGTSTDSGSGEKASGRPLRTRVASREFSKFDICPQKIERGEDPRSTIMVRNLTGAQARTNFLTFLEHCGLQDRYTFFYMPCKEHRNVPAGFAFINFLAPEDILALHRHVENGLWHDVLGDRQPKTPALSYARFQGHEELAKHFSSSAVLHEQDPDKRPIFRFSAKPQRKQQQQPQQPQQTQQSQQATQQQPALPPQQPQLQQQPQPPAHRQQPPLLQLPTQPQQPAAHQQPLVARPKDEADLGGAAAPCQQRRHQPPPQQQERCSPEVKGFAMVTGTGHTEKVGPALGEEALGGNRGAPAYVWTSQLLCDPIDKEGALVFGAPWSQLGGFLGAKGEMDRVLTLQMGA
mmetsp:Transcript_43062/g.121771  ORF Transcript_43062/g.121771 Transcript_43062/m.121771 type:complete len:594 (+) Transcript_43062:135-1916(+)